MKQQLNLFEKQIEIASKEEIPLHTIRQIVEALLFSSQEPLSLGKLREIISLSHVVEQKDLLKVLKELKEEYDLQQKPFQLEEIAQGYILRTRPEFAPFIERLQSRREDKLSKAALEVLAIVAYKQPITKAAIETLRGVDCSGPIYSLLDRQLIEGVGRLEMPGRPVQYGVTKRFLTHFGLKDTKQLFNPL
jgi:segregation and condensation protein B